MRFTDFIIGVWVGILLEGVIMSWYVVPLLTDQPQFMWPFA